MNKKILKKIAFAVMASVLIVGGETLIPTTNNTIVAQAANCELETVSWSDSHTPYFTRVYKTNGWPRSFDYEIDNEEGWTCIGRAYLDSWAPRNGGGYTVVYKGYTTQEID